MKVGNNLNEVVMKLHRLVWNMKIYFYTITLFEYGLIWFKYFSSTHCVHVFRVLLSQYIRTFRNKPAFLKGDDAEEVGSDPFVMSFLHPLV